MRAFCLATGPVTNRGTGNTDSSGKKEPPVKRLMLVLALLCLSLTPISAQTFFLGIPESANAWSYIPQIVDGSGWRTTVTIANPNTEPVTGAVWFRGDDGEHLYLDFDNQDGYWSAVGFEIPRFGMLEYTSRDTSPVTQVGWATIYASNLVQVTATYSSMDEAGNVLYSVSVPASLPAPQYFSAATPDLGVAVANIYNSEQVVRVVALQKDTDGLFFTGSVHLPSFGHSAKLLSEIIPDLPGDFTGSVLIQASKGYVSALTLRGEGGVYSSLPSGTAARPASHRHVIENVFRSLVNNGSVRANIPNFEDIELTVTSEMEISAYATRDGVEISLALAELLADSESELAFAIGHELGHVYQFRTGKQDFSRNPELDADAWGVFFAFSSDYDPYAGAGTLAKLEMVSGRADLNSQYLQEITSVYLSFNTRLDHIYDTIQDFCDAGESACEDFHNIFHPHIPGRR